MAEGGVNWQALFPTRWSFVIFVTYMMCFIFQGIMVTASQRPDYSYSYNTVTVVLLTEATKLVTSFILYIKDHKIVTFLAEIKKHFRVLLLYMIPALLYCFYNNLAFVNLAAFDPTTYFLLLQFRVVVTGIVFQIIFKKKLSTKQWISYIILTVGCIMKQLSTSEKSSSSQAPPTNLWDNLLSLHSGLLMVQVMCSCLAGVYNEKLLKDTGAEVHIMMQNIFMYIDSIICNLAVLLYRGELSFAFKYTSLIQIWQPIVIIIILNNAAVGIVTSLFLRSLNSILKTFASALELVFTAALSWVIFGIPINGWTFLAIALVSLASWMYSQNPVVNRGRLDEVEKAHDSEAEEKLLPRNAPTQV
ncbi:UDP-galactose transporter senju isoform X1 [Macrobrachium rosenbergii]|uniref:UDP-galactose transporter senju isoform X1 n=1 Tax=Macrobrachium rosenbergii TaxID=79674 RepID=UPI0034D594D4